MKRKVLHIAIICGMVLLGACAKKETTGPVLTVIGYSSITISLNSTYNDLGAQASDNLDVTDVITNDIGPTNPNVNLVGTYIIHYMATNTSGFTSIATRTVIVVNDAQKIAGGYSVADTITGQDSGIYNYSVFVAPSTTVDDLVYLINFSDLGDAVSVSALVFKNASTNTININPAGQVPEYMRPLGSITGNGHVVADSAITRMTYTITYSNSSTDSGHCTWTKQGPP